MTEQETFVTAKEFILKLQELALDLGDDTPVMVRRTGYTADYIRQAIQATAIERLEGTSNPPIGRFNVSDADDIFTYDDLGKSIILIN